jgi:hypothetical protein
LVATDAGAFTKLAWSTTVVAVVLVVIGSLVRSSAPIHLAVVLLGAVFLTRHDARLLLAPVYGAGLLLVAELGWRSIELRDLGRLGPGVQAARALAVCAVAGLGACVSAAAAAAVTSGQARTVALTAVAAASIVLIFATTVWRTRRAYPVTGVDGSPAQGAHGTADDRSRHIPRRD